MIWPGLQVEPLVQRLRRYNEWRRGADTEQPQPREIGEDIDEAVRLLVAMSSAIEATLDKNMHGNDCTLADIARVARGDKSVSEDRGTHEKEKRCEKGVGFFY